MKQEVFKRDGKTVVREEFDSLNEFVDVAIMRRPVKVGAYGPTDYERAIEMARHGWKEELPAAMEIADSAVKTLEREGIIYTPAQPVFDVQGGTVDIPLWLSGDPECMIDFPMPPTRVARPAIVLSRSFTYSARVSTISREAHGRAIMALCLALETMHIPLEIWADRPLGMASAGDVGWAYCDKRVLPGWYNEYYQLFPLKRAADILDMGQLMFALVHTDMLNELGFAVHKAAHPRNRTADEQAFFGDGAILTEHLAIGADPIAFVRDELKRLGLAAES